MTGRSGVPATGVGAVALNVTVTNPTAPVLPHRLAHRRPPTLSPPTSTTSPARPSPTWSSPTSAPTAASTSTTYAGTTDVIVDVLGWFPAGTAYTGLIPAR